MPLVSSPGEEVLRYECRRRQTFRHWAGLQDEEVLAGEGFLYTNYSDEVQCFCCNERFSHWQKTDSPNQRHLERSPDCLMAKREHPGNVPSPDQPGAIASADGNSVQFDSLEAAAPGHTNRDTEKYEKWKHVDSSKPIMISFAKAGFEVNADDEVRCRSCKVLITQFNGDPFEMHIRLNFGCQYIKKIDSGELRRQIWSSLSPQEKDAARANSIKLGTGDLRDLDDPSEQMCVRVVKDLGQNKEIERALPTVSMEKGLVPIQRLITACMKHENRQG